jgi:hypothetical protein
MRYVLGVMDDQLSGDFDFGAVAWTGWLVGRPEDALVGLGVAVTGAKPRASVNC